MLECLVNRKSVFYCFFFCLFVFVLKTPHILLAFWVFALALVKTLIKLKYLFDYESHPLILPNHTIVLVKLKVIQCPVISVNVGWHTSKPWHLVKWKVLFWLLIFLLFSFSLFCTVCQLSPIILCQFSRQHLGWGKWN